MTIDFNKRDPILGQIAFALAPEAQLDGALAWLIRDASSPDPVLVVLSKESLTDTLYVIAKGVMRRDLVENPELPARRVVKIFRDRHVVIEDAGESRTAYIHNTVGNPSKHIGPELLRRASLGRTVVLHGIGEVRVAFEPTLHTPGRFTHPALDAMWPIDFADPTFLTDPYPALEALRESAAVLHDERLQRWLVTRHADVRACLRDRRLGRNFRHVGSEKEFAAEPLDARWSAFWDVERWSLLWLEPPEHTRIRKLVAAAFTPRSVEALRAPARALADELLAPLVARGHMELLSDFAQPYSIRLICHLLGVPLGHERELLEWSHRMVKMYELHVSDADAAAANEASRAFRAFVVALLEERRRVPEDDLLTRLATASVDNELLTDAEIVSTIVVLLNAGHEATVNTLGNGLLALIRHPGEWARLCDGSVSPASAVEEMLRWDPPLQLFERWVLEDGFEVSGVPIPRGSRIALLFGAANRDPCVFADPDRFDVGRVNAGEHIGFGGGIHSCIGAPLARIELEAALGAIVARAPELTLAEAPRRTGSFVIWGLEALRLRL